MMKCARDLEAGVLIQFSSSGIPPVQSPVMVCFSFKDQWQYGEGPWQASMDAFSRHFWCLLCARLDSRC